MSTKSRKLIGSLFAIALAGLMVLQIPVSLERTEVTQVHSTPSAHLAPESRGKVPMQAGKVQPSFNPVVSNTLVLENNSLVKGNFLPLNGAELSTSAFDPATGDLYIISTGDNCILVVNATTNTWIGGVALGFSPPSIMYDPEDQELYVPSGPNNLTLFNPTTLANTGQVTVGPYPGYLVYDIAHHEIYVLDTQPGEITVLNASTNANLATWSVGGYPQFAGLDTRHETLLVIDDQEANVSVLNVTTGKVIANVGVGGYPMSLVTDPAVNRAFVRNENNITVINTALYQTQGVQISAEDYDGLALNPGTNQLFFPSFNFVSVYNASTLAFIKNIPSGFGGYPTYVPGFNRVYVALEQTANMTVINAATDKQLVRSIPLGTLAGPVAVAPVGGNLFVENIAGDNLSRVNLSSDHIVGWSGSYQYPESEVLNSVTDQIYLQEGIGASIEIINAATGASVGTKTLPTEGAMAFDPANLDLYLASNGYPSSYVYVVNTTTWATVAQIAVGREAQGIAYDPVNRMVYDAENWFGNVSVISTVSQSVVATIPTGNMGLTCVAVDPIAGEVFAVNGFHDDVYVISTSTDSIKGAISVVQFPQYATYDPGDNMVFVSSYFTNSVSVISPSSLSVTETIGVGIQPEYLDYSIPNDAVYVSNYESGTVTIINTGPSLPLITSYAATPAVIDIDQNTNLTVTAIYGTLPYTISYSGLPSGCVSANISKLLCRPSSAGRFTVTITVKDMNGNTATSGLTLQVGSDPAISSFKASPQNITIGTNATLKVVAIGGTGYISYSYSGLPPGCAGGNSSALLCYPTKAGSYVVNVTIKDAVNFQVHSSLILYVNVIPFVTNFIATPGIVDIGFHTFLNATVGGGTAPLAFNYSGLPTGCLSQDVASLECTPMVMGNFDVRVLVKDALNVSVQAFATLIVESHLTFVSASVTPSTIDEGNLTVLSMTVSGGISPVSYSYAGIPTGCASNDSPAIVCTPGETGAFTVHFFAVDAAGVEIEANSSLVVNPRLSIISAAATPSHIELGNSTTVAVVAGGGTAPMAYSYSGLPPGCTSSNVASLKCMPTTTGTFTVEIIVADSAGSSIVAFASLEVGSTFTFVSASVSPSFVIVGASAVFSISVSGGASPVTYSYSGLPEGCTSTNVPALTCRPAESGNFSVNITATDSSGASVRATVYLDVGSAMTLVSASATPSTIVVGSSTTFSMVVNGGTAPLTYSYIGLPQGCISADSPTLLCTPASTGNFTVTITATDVHQQSVVASVELEVTAHGTAHNTANQSQGYSPMIVYALIGAVIVLAVLLVVLLLARRNKKEGSPAGPAPPPPPPINPPPQGLAPPQSPVTGPVEEASPTS
jgi:YVTN family beta-propeller protein